MNFNNKLENKNDEEVKYEITTAMELINKVKSEPEPKFLWKGIPEGSAGLITGAIKTGKSTFAQNLAISISVGKKEYFGQKLDGIPRKVAYINLEENYRVYSRRLAEQIAILNQMELKLFEENYIDTPVNFPEFITNEEEWADMYDYLKRSEADVIIIDSLTHMVIGEIEKSYVVQTFMQNFRKYVRSLEKTVLVVHHTVKGNDKPIEQDSIAGSRLVIQEFEFALGFANIPTEKGGSYCCMLFNKYIENDSSLSQLYKIRPDRWFELLDEDNKYALYKESKTDYRIKSANRDLILEFMQSQHSQGSQDIKAKELISEFVTTKKMSKDTLYKSLDKLQQQSKVFRVDGGKYSLKKKDSKSEKKAEPDEEEKGNNIQSAE